MRRLSILFALAFILAFATPSFAQYISVQGYCEQGGQTVTTGGIPSTTKVQKSYPICSVTVYVHGGAAATIYATDTGGGLGNPFTASATGHWQFYAAAGRYDVTLSGGGIAAPFTIYDISATDVLGGTGPFVASLLPTIDNTYNLGSSIKRWANGYFTTVHSTSYTGNIQPVFNVVTYGADTTGAADSGAAIIAAGAALQAAGGGTLYFPPGTYKIYGVGTTYTTLCTFVNLNGVAIVAEGAGLSFDPSRVFVSVFSTFWFINCSNVRINGVYAFGASTWAHGTSPIGPFLFNFQQGSHDIDISSVSVNGGFIAAVGFIKASGDPASYACYNIHIADLSVKECMYGISCQYSGNNLEANLYAEHCNRSYFPYGIKNHKVHVLTKNQGGVLINAYHGYGCEDVELWFTDLGSIDSQDLDYKIMVNWEDAYSAAHRNIRIHANILYPAGVQNGSYGLYIGKSYPAIVATLENFELDGIMDGAPHSAGAAQIAVVGTYTSADLWRNINFKNLILRNSPLNPDIKLGGLIGDALFENVYSDFEVLVHNDAGTGPPETGRVTYRGCDWSSITSKLENIPTPTGVVIPVGYQGHSVTNVGATGTITDTLPAAVPGLEFSFFRIASQTFRIDPNGSDVIRGGGVGKYASLDTDGGHMHIECKIAGMWEVMDSYGTITREP